MTLFPRDEPPVREAVEPKPGTLRARTGVAWPVRGERRSGTDPRLLEELAGLRAALAADDADAVRWCLVALLFWLDGEPLTRAARGIEGLLVPEARKAA